MRLFSTLPDIDLRIQSQIALGIYQTPDHNDTPQAARRHLANMLDPFSRIWDF